MSKQNAAKLLFGTVEKLVAVALLAIVGIIAWVFMSPAPLEPNIFRGLLAGVGTLAVTTFMFYLYFRDQLKGFLNLND